MAKKILIVEDEPSLSKVLRKRVEQLGFDVVVAVDGREALTKIKSDEPDLVILDIIMPGKNGLEVLRELRVNMENDVPVMMVTNIESQQDIDASKHYHVVDYIFKSDISLSDLTAKIVKALGVT